MADEIRLSPQQRRLWQVAEAAGTALRARAELALGGDLDAGLLFEVLKELVARHEILRTTFEPRPWLKVPLQVIAETGTIAWAPAGAPLEARETDLGRGPLFQAALASGPDGGHLLTLELPALCCDLRSLANLAMEIERGYAARRGAPAEEPGEPLQYADFSEWQHELLAGEDPSAAAGRAHWEKQDLAPARSLRLPCEREARDRFQPEEIPLDLGGGLSRAIEETGRAAGVSTAAVLLAAWSVLLWRLSGQPEVVVGQVFDGRKYEDLHGGIGAFSRCLPVRVLPNPRLRFRDLAVQVQGALREAGEWQEYCDPEESLKLAGQDLVSPFGFELEEVRPGRRGGPLAVSARRLSAWTERFHAKLSCLHTPDGLTATLGFDAAVFGPVDARRLGRQLLAVLERATADPEVLAGDVGLAPVEDLRLAAALNETAAPLPVPRCFHHLFAEQAARTPDRAALVFEERSLTYAALDERANRLAHHLSALGVGPDVRVALLLERSLEMVVALLGTLKAGGAYVPLDPAYPTERLAALLADSGAAAVVAQDHLAGNLPAGGPPVVRLEADAGAIASRPASEPRSEARPENLAYVLFTSGSTGRPKGVAVEHRQLSHYLHAIARELRPAEGDGFATVSTFGADLGNTVVFPSLAFGGCLHVLSQERISDAVAVAEYFARHEIAFLKIVPSHLAALAAGGLEVVLPRRTLVLGGEAASPELIGRLRVLDAPAVLNHYGPTETTVGATTGPLDREAAGDAGRLPLGRPLANTRVHLLDMFQRPVPVGVPGEVYIGGDGVSRGYLGRPDATAERFVPDPFPLREGDRLYRTGDLARLLPDGRLEFAGRADHQVKIRGFRIEPGEIEAAMARHPEVREAVVLVREEKPGERRLAGFAARQRGARLTAAGLRAELRRLLPEYMVPPVLTVVDAFPLTPNGKLDRQALLALEAGEARPRAAVPPRDPREALLARIWEEVLGVESVGIHDNFFELGGDSILVIQVIARASKAGLRFNPRQLFQHQTIAELAATAETLPEILAEQGAVAGEVLLTPIQRWFFGLSLPAPHHWNQSVVLEPREELDPAPLGAILAHHDALRSRFRRVAGEWRQEVVPPDGVVPFERHDLSALEDGEREEAFAALAEQVQGGLDLTRGPLLRAAWIDLGPGRGCRLLFAVHHLVVDGVSWRVILEDLTTALRQLAAGGGGALPAKTTSFRQWAGRLAGHARSGALDGEIAFWEAASAPAAPLPVDFPAARGGNDEASSRTVAVTLGEAETDRLLRVLPKVCRAQINEVLLSALLRTFAAWTGGTELHFDLEGHGREPLFDDVDLSRTVGWFTTHFPVRLSALAGAGPEEALRAAKEQLRAVPGRGIGHGLLRHLTREEAGRRLAGQPEVSFNYLGQLDGSFDGSLFRRAGEPAGPSHDPSGERPYLLQVSGIVLDGRLRLDWTYSENRHRRETVELLAESFLGSLRELLDAAAPGKPLAWTASDFPLSGIGGEALEKLLAGAEIEDLYPLSPLQGGLLFHSLYEPGSGLYIGQLDCLLAGDLDIAAFEAAWRLVVERHPIFRTSFLWEGLDRPLQVVAPRADLPIERHDWRGLPEDELEARREAWLAADRQAGYDLARPPLMRIALCRREQDSWGMFWSHHHLLLDGWSLALLAQDLFGVYARLRAGGAVEPVAARPYRDYIAWLQERDLEEARVFWQEALRGFTAPNSLDRVRTGRVAEEREGLDEHWLALPEEPAGALQDWLRSHQITLNTLVQGVWAVLLGHYSGDEDVVFGSTVAGRPTELAGFESMIGVFINTLPVRARVEPAAELLPWLADLQARQVEARQLEHTPLVEIQGWSGLPRGVPLFESVMVVENYPTGESAERGFEIREMRYSMKENFPLIFTVLPGRELRIKIKYEASRFSRAAILRMADLFLAVLERISAAPDVRLADLLGVLAEADRQRQSEGEKRLKDLRMQKFEQVRRKAVPAPEGERA
jgi:amino acid adenylation domain-containing protein/non-ribosomal peptide synthase protein (TIGR01720 family)